MAKRISKENRFQNQLIQKIKAIFPDSIVLKNDPNYIQGIPDLLVLIGKNWLALECKRYKDAHRQVNQEYYISKMNDMSYARFIYPDNEQEVLDELQQTFKS